MSEAPRAASGPPEGSPAPARTPPGPRGLPVVGSLLPFYANPLRFTSHTARTYGDVARVRIAGVPFLLLSHPSDIETVLVTRNRDFRKGRLDRDRRLLFGQGLATSDGELWLRQRRLSQPAFHRERIAAYGELMGELAQRRLDEWPQQTVVDLHRLFMQLTLEIVGKVLFGADVGPRATEVGASLEILMAYFGSWANFFLRLLPKNAPWPGRAHFRATVARLDEIIFDLIQERRRDEREHNDLLSMLVSARDEDDSQMSDQQLRDELMTVFLAGHETTALALSWAFVGLAQHPDTEARLVGELDEVLGERAPTVHDLPRLAYARQVVQESMRLYPPAWVLVRQAVRDVEIGGYRVPAHAFVSMSPWVVHRDPRNFDDPESFRPERWADGLADRLPKFAYFPFGGGQRVCIGNGLAMMEATLLLAGVCHRFRFRPSGPVKPDPSLSLRPKNGVRGALEPRR